MMKNPLGFRSWLAVLTGVLAVVGAVIWVFLEKARPVEEARLGVAAVESLAAGPTGKTEEEGEWRLSAGEEDPVAGIRPPYPVPPEPESPREEQHFPSEDEFRKLQEAQRREWEQSRPESTTP